MFVCGRKDVALLSVWLCVVLRCWLMLSLLCNEQIREPLLLEWSTRLRMVSFTVLRFYGLDHLYSLFIK